MPWKASVSEYRGACEETQSRACLLKLSCPLTAEDSGDPLSTRLLCLHGPYQAWQARVDCASQPLGHPSSQVALPSTTAFRNLCGPRGPQAVVGQFSVPFPSVFWGRLPHICPSGQDPTPLPVGL